MSIALELSRRGDLVRTLSGELQMLAHACAVLWVAAGHAISASEASVHKALAAASAAGEISEDERDAAKDLSVHLGVEPDGCSAVRGESQVLARMADEASAGKPKLARAFLLASQHLAAV